MTYMRHVSVVILFEREFYELTCLCIQIWRINNQTLVSCVHHIIDEVLCITFMWWSFCTHFKMSLQLSLHFPFSVQLCLNPSIHFLHKARGGKLLIWEQSNKWGKEITDSVHSAEQGTPTVEFWMDLVVFWQLMLHMTQKHKTDLFPLYQYVRRFVCSHTKVT